MTGHNQHPRHGLDELIHAPVRLSVMAALSAGGKVHFGLLRDTVEVSDSLLSKHLKLLEEAGLVVVDKGYVGKRPRTWLSLSPKGSRAYRQYVSALNQILDTSASQETEQAE